MDLWLQDMDVFAQDRTRWRALRLAVSQVACLGRHTITGLLSVGGRCEQDWSRDYRLFSESPWEAPALFGSVLRGVHAALDPSAPLVVAMDDTLIRKTGKKIPGAGYLRDPLSPPFRPNFVRGQRFIEVSAMLPEGAGPAPALALPVRFDEAPPVRKPRKKDPPEVWKQYYELRRTQNLSMAGVRALRQLRARLDRLDGGVDRLLVSCVDGSYTNRNVLSDLPERTLLIGRIRKDAHLCFLPQQQPDRGRKRTYGPQAPTPEALLKDDSIPWQQVSAYAAGKVHPFRVKTLGPLLWPKVGADQLFQMIVVAPVGYRLCKGGKLERRDPAYLICTDPQLLVSPLLQEYLWRWGVECNHRDGKQLLGVGEARVRSPLSARREPVFAAACYAKLLLAGAMVFGTQSPAAVEALPKWRRRGSHGRLTTGDLIRRFRQELWRDMIRPAETHSDHFEDNDPCTTKWPKLAPSPWPAINHAATG